jgi:hypothetical protein
MPADPWTAKAARYAALRWLGVAGFLLAAALLLGGLAAVATGRASFGLLPLCLLGLGLSLGSFGTNDDAALHAFAELARRGALPDRFRAEWEAERARRPARVSAVHDHPRASLILPLAAWAALAYVSYRVVTAWSGVA